MLYWAHRNTARAHRATWARRVLPGKPCLSGSGPGSPPTSFPLPLRGCLAPPSSPTPLGLFPTRTPHPLQDSLVDPPPPHPGSLLLFDARPSGTWGHRSANLALWQALASLLAWEAQTAPPFRSWKKQVQRGEETCLQSPDWKASTTTRTTPGSETSLDPLPAAQGLRQGQARQSGPRPGCRRGLFEGPGTQRCRGWQGLPVEKLARTEPGQGFL